MFSANCVIISVNLTELLRFYYFAIWLEDAYSRQCWEFRGFWPLKLWRHYFNPKRTAVCAQSRVLTYSAVSPVGLSKRVTLTRNVELLYFTHMGRRPSNPTDTNFCMWSFFRRNQLHQIVSLSPQWFFCEARLWNFCSPIDLIGDLYNSWSSTEPLWWSTTGELNCKPEQACTRQWIIGLYVVIILFKAVLQLMFGTMAS